MNCDTSTFNDLKVYVGNLPFTASKIEISNLFSKYGKIVGINLREDRKTGKPKGFGFITYQNSDEATKVIELMNGFIYEGRQLTVGKADKRGLEKTNKEEKNDWMTSSTKTKLDGKKSWNCWTELPNQPVTSNNVKDQVNPSSNNLKINVDAKDLLQSVLLKRYKVKAITDIINYSCKYENSLYTCELSIKDPINNESLEDNLNLRVYQGEKCTNKKNAEKSAALVAYQAEMKFHSTT